MFLARIEFRALRRRVTKHARVQSLALRVPNCIRGWTLASSDPESQAEVQITGNVRIKPSNRYTPDPIGRCARSRGIVKESRLGANVRDKLPIRYRLVVIEDDISTAANAPVVIRALLVRHR